MQKRGWKSTAVRGVNSAAHCGADQNFISLICRNAFGGHDHAHVHFLSVSQDSHRDHVAFAHIDHHIRDLILPCYSGGATVYGCAYDNIVRLQSSLAERAFRDVIYRDRFHDP